MAGAGRQSHIVGCGTGAFRRWKRFEGEKHDPRKVVLVVVDGSGMGADAARRHAAGGFQFAILSSSGKCETRAKELGGLGITRTNRSPDDFSALVDEAMYGESATG